MLDRTDELVSRLAEAGTIDPPTGVELTGLLLWTSLHGIVSLRINKDTFGWPDAEALALLAMMSLLRPSGS